MEPEARIHSFNALRLDEMHLMYAPSAVAHPPKI
jgi:hypothetical protein